MSESDELARAARAWDVSNETLRDVNLRIHDAIPEALLEERADGNVTRLVSTFPEVRLTGGRFLEIGSGTGYIMEALHRYAARRGIKAEITGLDISESMIAKAVERLGSKVGKYDFSFVSYDGLNVPFENNQFDFIYSVATLQHIPKAHVYNLMFEIKRILKPDGFAVLSFLPFSLIPRQEKHWPWEREIAQQVGRIPSGHWHFFYSEEELNYVLRDGTGFSHVHIDNRFGLWVCLGKTSLRQPSWLDPRAYLDWIRGVAGFGRGR
jgi:ubiquinone/menaquinone biosynthesis C-methylase UbiE